MLELSAVLIALGFIVLLVAIARTQRLIGILKDVGPWPSLRNLIGFFAVGYAVYLLFMLTGRPFDRDLLTAEVFFLAAVFILMAVRFSYRTIHQVMRLDELEAMAHTDDLTGLFNRRAILKILEEEFYKARRFGFPLSVAMLDLDSFKPVNDTWGHISGDTVLREVAGMLRTSLRRIDVVGRYGGEEFLCVLPSTPVGGAYITGERMRNRSAQLRFAVDEKDELRLLSGEEAADGEVVTITVSVGVATLDATTRTPEELVGAADRALYFAKESGRDRTCTATEVVS
ncbi:MAG: GGDEF domain-containing protein [bacterium]